MSPSAGPQVQAGAENSLGRAMAAVLAIAEGYPALQASRHFHALQEQLAETEDRITAGRRFYNGNVRALNTRVESFPSGVVAKTCGFRRAEYFEVDDIPVRSTPGVGQRFDR